MKAPRIVESREGRAMIAKGGCIILHRKCLIDVLHVPKLVTVPPRPCHIHVKSKELISERQVCQLPSNLTHICQGSIIQGCQIYIVAMPQERGDILKDSILLMSQLLCLRCEAAGKSLGLLFMTTSKNSTRGHVTSKNECQPQALVGR